MQQRPHIIGITGGSGSGKTVFLKAVATPFDESQVCIISQDDYYLPREMQPEDPNGVNNFDLPECFDAAAFARDIERLRNGETVTREEYVYNNEKATPKLLTFKPAPVIIVEGIFVFHFEAVRALMDLKVFIDAREELKIIRRIKRDQIERNYPLDDVLYRYEHHVSPAFERYIAPYRHTADLIVNNHDNYQTAAQVLVGYVKSLLPTTR